MSSESKTDLGLDINLVPSTLPGEKLGVALLGFLGKWVDYEKEVLKENPELALASRARFEAFLDRSDKFFVKLFD